MKPHSRCQSHWPGRRGSVRRPSGSVAGILIRLVVLGLIALNRAVAAPVVSGWSATDEVTSDRR